MPPLSSEEERIAEAKRIKPHKIKVIKTLLKTRASSQIDTPNFQGHTPLDLAIAQKEDDVVSLFQAKLKEKRKIATLGAMHLRSGRNSFWKHATLTSLQDIQVFRVIFKVGLGKSS